MNKKFIALVALTEDAMEEMQYIDEYGGIIHIMTDGPADKADEAREKLKKMRYPSRKRIKDDLRMIRRITLDIERSIWG